MDADFYQRDVGAEYDELDYDAEEQFDDDDVDVGEREGMGAEGGGGFAADAEDDDPDDEEAGDDDSVGGDDMLAGLASSAGMKFLMAKARGETVEEATGAQPAGTASAAGDGKAEETASASAGGASADQGGDEGGGGSLAKIMAGAEKAKAEAEQKKRPAAPPVDMTAAVEYDDNGQRIITLDAVRREIWLHHGAVTTKRLFKLFDIKKKKTSEERYNKFRDVVKELCTMKVDNVEGNMFVLKQHYSKMR